MEQGKISKFLIVMIVFSLALLPVHVPLCQAEQLTLTPTAKKTAVSEKDSPTLEDSKKKATTAKHTAPVTQRVAKTTEAEAGKAGLSTGMKIGLGAGAVVLIGVAVAAGGSSGSDSDSGSSSGSTTTAVPPTSAQVAGAYNAAASQSGSGLTYTGTFVLYPGGGLAYNIAVSDGERLAGGGSWSLNSYNLYVRTDHGSLYSGTFTPGIYTSITLRTSTGWTSILSR